MLRKILFWSHLVCGLVAGALIGIMSFTGAALTFEKDLIAWAERDARRIDPPAANAPRLPLAELLPRVRAVQADVRINTIVVSADPREAIAFGAPNNRTFCANPYTGEVREASAPRMRAFMQTMRSWHTRLNVTPPPPPAPGAPRPANPGAVANAAANVVFVFLGVSGLILWWPRAWNLRVLRPSLWFNADARARARDWNWHNVIGFWSLPIILILAGTGVVLSYRWAGDLVYTLSGEKPPTPGAPAAPTPSSVGLRPAPSPAATPAPTPPPAAAVLTPDALLAAAQKPYADWSLLTLRFNPPLSATPSTQPPPRNFTVVAKTKSQWPPFFSNTLALDAVTGEVRRTDTFAALSTGTKARRWIRLLHSAEALGPWVALISGLACLGGCVLVYTGFALAWRRFFVRSPS